MNIQNGLSFANNYSRAAAYLLGTCAPAPANEADAAAYEFITAIYKAIIKDPVALGFKPSQNDITFIPWETQKGREKDVKLIRDPIAKLETLVKELFELVDAGELCEEGILLAKSKPKKQIMGLISVANGAFEPGEHAKLKLPKGCGEGLKKLCEISKENIIHITDGAKEDKAYLYFSRLVFDPSSDWTARVFDKYLKADGRILWLAHELESRGYTRIDCRDGKKVSLDYVKQHGKKQEPVKCAWGERVHSGIELTYEELQLTPGYLWLRMPMFKTVLEHIDELPENVAQFITSWTKTCNGCRYCVQTDKTGKRPLAAMKINEKMKCPLYPGFTMNWRELEAGLEKDIVCVLNAIDALLK